MEVIKINQVILNSIKTLEVATERMIAKWLGITLKVTRAGILSLEDQGMIKVSREGLCPWGNCEARYWQVTEEGDLYSEVIANPKSVLVQALPYRIDYGVDSDRFTAQYKAKAGKGLYNAELRVFPGGKMKFKCECYDFLNTKQQLEPCKHLINLRDNLRKNNEIENTDFWREA